MMPAGARQRGARPPGTHVPRVAGHAPRPGDRGCVGRTGGRAGVRSGGAVGVPSPSRRRPCSPPWRPGLRRADRRPRRCAKRGSTCSGVGVPSRASAEHEPERGRRGGPARSRSMEGPARIWTGPRMFRGPGSGRAPARRSPVGLRAMVHASGVHRAGAPALLEGCDALLGEVPLEGHGGGRVLAGLGTTGSAFRSELDEPGCRDYGLSETRGTKGGYRLARTDKVSSTMAQASTSTSRSGRAVLRGMR